MEIGGTCLGYLLIAIIYIIPIIIECNQGHNTSKQSNITNENKGSFLNKTINFNC